MIQINHSFNSNFFNQRGVVADHNQNAAKIPQR